MKKFYILWIMMLFAIALISCKEAEEEPIIEPVETDYSNCKAKGYDYDFRAIDDYDLVWADEFNVNGLPDSTKWGYDVGGSGWGNNELQYYTNNGNAWIEDGRLIIEARKETYLNREYTSARLVTRNKQSFKYGRIEIKAILPTGRGTWPALWMLPTTSYYGGWPDSGEIDIMEHVGYDQNVIHGSIHTEDFNHKIGTQKGGSVVIDTASSEYHVYAIEWLPDRIIFSVDDQPYYTFVPGLYLKCPTSEQWPFDIGFHLLFNIAIGGDWGGAQGIDDTIFPQRMTIDYVRVYQSDFITNLQKG